MTGQALTDAIRTEIAGLERLLAILKEEEAALIGAHIDRLSEIIPTKSLLISELEQASQARKAQMQAEGVSDHRDTIASWLSQQSGTQQQQWQHLLKLAEEAAQYNRSNGRLIQSREEAQRAFLNSINHQQANGDIGYTASGRITGHNKRRPFEKA